MSKFKRVLDYDALTGRTIYHDYDPATDETTYHTQMDIAPIVEHCKQQASMYDPHIHRKGDFWYVGEIPFELAAEWKQNEGIDVWNPDHADAIKRKLNDGDFSLLRTMPGTI
jgi:hypothetical protein